MNLGVESRMNLSRRAGKFNCRFAARNSRHRKALLLQPCTYFRDVGVARAIELAELIWREPAMIAGTARPMRLLYELLQSKLAIRRALQQKQHAFGWKGIRHRTQFVASLRQRMNISLQRHPRTIVNGLCNARSGTALRWRWIGKTQIEKKNKTTAGPG